MMILISMNHHLIGWLWQATTTHIHDWDDHWVWWLWRWSWSWWWQWWWWPWWRGSHLPGLESAPWLFHISLHLKILENPELIIAMTITSILITFTFFLTSSENIRKSRADNQDENFLHFHFHHFHFHVISSENNGRSRGVVSMTVTSYLDSDDDEVNENAGCRRIRRGETFWIPGLLLQKVALQRADSRSMREKQDILILFTIKHFRSPSTWIWFASL